MAHTYAHLPPDTAHACARLTLVCAHASNHGSAPGTPNNWGKVLYEMRVGQLSCRSQMLLRPSFLSTPMHLVRRGGGYPCQNNMPIQVSPRGRTCSFNLFISVFRGLIACSCLPFSFCSSSF